MAVSVDHIAKDNTENHKESLPSLKQAKSWRLLDLISSHEGRFPKKMQMHHQSKDFCKQKSPVQLSKSC